MKGRGALGAQGWAGSREAEPQVAGVGRGEQASISSELARAAEADSRDR